MARAEKELEKAEKTCEEKEKKHEVAQERLEELWAANPGDSTSARYVRLETAQERAYAAYEVAQTRVEDAQGALAVKQAVQTCAEMEKEYEVAQAKLAVHKAAHPGDTTSAGYNELNEAEEAARVANKVARRELAVAPPTRELKKAEKTCAEKEKKHEVAQERLEELWAAHPGDTTSAAYVWLETAQERAYAAYEAAQTRVEDAQGALAVKQAVQTCAEMEKEYEVAQAKLAVHKAAHPGDTTSAAYVWLETAQERAYAAYEAAQTRVEDAQGALAVKQAVQTCAEMEKEYEVAQAKLAVHKAAHPGDTTSRRHHLCRVQRAQ